MTIFSMTKSTTHFKEKRHWLGESYNEEEMIIKVETEILYNADIKVLQDSFFNHIPEGFKQYWIDVNTNYEDKDIEFVDYVEYHNGYEYDTEICVWFNEVEVNESLYKALEEFTVLQREKNIKQIYKNELIDVNKMGTFHTDGKEYVVDTAEGQMVGKVVYSRNAEYGLPSFLKPETDIKK